PAVSQPQAVVGLPASAALLAAVFPPPAAVPRPAAALRPLHAPAAGGPAPPDGFAPPGVAGLHAVVTAVISSVPPTQTARWDTPAERRAHPRDCSIARREPISQLPRSTPPGAQRKNPQSARTIPRAFADPWSP